MAAPTELSPRESILVEGQRLTSQDRNSIYGPPTKNLLLAGKLEECFYAFATKPIGPRQRATLTQVFSKLSRIGCGKALHRDNYVDAATYMAIAWECAEADEADLQKEDTYGNAIDQDIRSTKEMAERLVPRRDHSVSALQQLRGKFPAADE